MKDVLLFSGGLDSFIAWNYLDKPPALYVPLGHRYEKEEVLAVHQISQETGMDVTIDMRLRLGDMEQEDAHIPMRNLFLVSIAAFYGQRIWLVVQKGETDLPDRSPKFFERFTKFLRGLNDGKKYQVDSPFWHMTKTDMVKWYVDKGFNPDHLLLTTSCYSGGSKPCGECKACFRRWVALSLNGITEDYQVNPWTTKLAHTYLDRALAGHYGFERDREIIEALKRYGVTHNV